MRHNCTSEAFTDPEQKGPDPEKEKRGEGGGGGGGQAQLYYPRLKRIKVIEDSGTSNDYILP